MMTINPANLSEFDVIMHITKGISGLRQLDKSDICLITLYGLIAVLSLGGNGLFLYLSIRYSRLRRHISFLMINLAGSNLLVTCFCIPASVYRLFYLTWRLGAVGCKLVMFVEGLAFSVNSFSLAAIAIIRARQSATTVLADRAAPNVSGGRCYRLVAAAIWAGALVASIPALFAVSLDKLGASDVLNLSNSSIPWELTNRANRHELYLCSEFRRDPAGRTVQKAFSAYFLFMLFLSPCVVLAFSYGFTARFITRQFARLANGGQQRQPRHPNCGDSTASAAVGSLSMGPMRPNRPTFVRGRDQLDFEQQQRLQCRQHPLSEDHARELQQKTVRTVVVLVAVFFVCWMPKDLVIVMQDFMLQDWPSMATVLTSVYPYTQALVYLHSAACPFLYWCLSRVYQSYAARALCCRNG